MKKINRIKKRKEFNYIFKNGKSISSKNIVLIYTPSKLKVYKIGYSVSKKVGKAVVRNKVKRRMKEAVLKVTSKLVPKMNYIFVAKPSASEATFLEICENINFLVNKIGLTKAEL